MRVTEGEEKTEEWLEGLQANNAQIFAKNGEILEAVNNGTVSLGLINHYYWARSEQDPTTLRAQLSSVTQAASPPSSTSRVWAS